jgi:hypothetical protein
MYQLCLNRSFQRFGNVHPHLGRKWCIIPCVIQINTKFANFAGLYQRLDTIKMCHSTYFPNVCVSVIFTYCQNGGEIDGVEFDTYWQNGGYKKISDIMFAEWHIFIVSNLWLYFPHFTTFRNQTLQFYSILTCSFLLWWLISFFLPRSKFSL